MKLFLDDNVLFTAAHNPSRKAALVVELQPRAKWALATSTYALEQSVRNLQRKAPGALDRLDGVVERLEVVRHRPDLEYPTGLTEKNRPIFQAALGCGASHLLTGDLTKKAILPVTMAAFLLAAVPAHAQEEPQEAYTTDRMSAQEAHDASLIDDLSNVPELSIPLHELESKEDLIKTVREHFNRHTRHPSHVPDPHMSADVERVLEAIEAGDDDRLRETLSEIAGTEVRIPTGEFTPHGDAVPFDGQFLSTPEEALARLSPEHVEALAGLRHLLDDRTALLRALDDVSELEREAAMEYMSIRLMLHGMRQRPNVYPPEVSQNLEKAKERGWYDASDRQAPGSHLLTLAELQIRNRADNVVPLAPASLAAAGFGEYIPETAASYSFTVPGQEERKEVIADTKFGGVLFVEKTKAGHVQPHDPNLHITGYDGSVRTVKYADAWVTIVTAFDGRHMYQLALEKKLLEGNPERDEFVRMAIAMIEDHLSKPLANEPEGF